MPTNEKDIQIKYMPLISEIKKLPSVKKKEKSIFQVGGRGHYENPTSTLLAFFLNPLAEHNLDNFLLKSLLETIFHDSYNDFDITSFIKVNREFIAKGKRIDLFIEGSDWTLTIENKIRAKIDNPLIEYRSYIQSKYRDKKNYFIILCKNNKIEYKGWKNINYSQLIDRIEKNKKQSFSNTKITRWVVLLDEFLLNIKNEIGINNMEKDHRELVENNYSEITKLIKLREEYHAEIIHECKSLFADTYGETEISANEDNWKNATAIRFKAPNLWGRKTNIALVLMNNGSFKLRIYLYDISDNINLIKNLTDIFSEFEFWTEGSIQCFGKEKIDGINESIAEFNKVLELLKPINLLG